MHKQYSPKVLDHYRHPRNFGKLKKATHTASELNPLCGDEITVYLQIKDNEIKDLRYEARGCALSIAAASVLSEGIRKQELGIREIQKMGKEDVEKILGVNVNAARQQCIMLAVNTIHKALRQPLP